MKRVYTDSDPLMVGHLEQVLEERGVHCTVRNRLLAGGIGELPPNEVWPELWVLRDDDEPLATRIISETLAPQAEPGPDWTCRRCGERIEGQFSACWNCGQ